MTESFTQLLKILGDGAQPLPVARLPELSDLDPSQIDQLRSAWPQVPSSHRNSLLGELGQLADLHFEYSFESVNRIALGDEDPDVRRIAVENLWECEDATFAHQLLELLQEDDAQSVRSAAATALAPFVYRCEVSDLDPAMLGQIEDALLNASQNDRKMQVRLRALEALGHSSRAELPPIIHQAYDVGDDDHKNAALVAMGRSASKDWADIITSEFHNASPQLRAQAALAAGKIELRESVSDLIDLLGDVSSEVRYGAIWSLGQLGGSNAIEAMTDLQENTEDPDEAGFIDEAIDHAIFIDSTPGLEKGDADQDEGIII